MLVLDILIGTLIVLPLLADAVWYDTSDAWSLELSDMGIPMLVVALVVVLTQRLSRISFRPGAIALQGSEWRADVLLSGGLLGIFLLAYCAAAGGLISADLASSALWNFKRRPGAVLVVALAAIAVRRWSPEPWERSFFLRLGMRLRGWWLGAVERSPARSLWGAVAALTAFFLWLGLRRYWAFETHGYDLGIFTNAMWNLTHGNGYMSSVKGGINLFLDHQSPLFWALAPLFWAVPRPETLLFVQTLGLSAGGPALYHLGRAQFGRDHWAPAALPWLYWCWLPLRNAAAFDFHPEVFMLPLVLWACVGFLSDRRWAKALGVLALIAALGAKESAGVVVAGIGLGWALTGGLGPARARWPGLALFAVGAAVFWLDLKVVPGMFGGEYAYMEQYERFGGGIGSVLLAPFVQPAYFFSELFNPPRLNFLLWTLAPLAFLPLFDWRAAVAAAPPYLMLFLAEGDQRVKIIFHYGIEPGTALFWALPFGLATFARKFGWRNAGIWMLLWALAFLGPTELTRARNYEITPHKVWLKDEALPCLDRDIPIAASDVLVAHLATRRWISDPDLLEVEPSGDPVACVVTDLSKEMDNWPLGIGGTEQLRKSLPERGYREAYRCGEFVVYERAGASCLRCTPKCD
jgi:uncharacterized membrane protein